MTMDFDQLYDQMDTNTVRTSIDELATARTHPEYPRILREARLEQLKTVYLTAQRVYDAAKARHFAAKREGDEG
jgi:hypothetical protein